MPEPSSNIAIFGLIGALIGAVPAVLGVLFTWLKGRDTVSRSLKKIELLKAEVDFIKAWTEAISSVVEHDELKSRKEAARARLDDLMQITEKDLSETCQDIQSDSVTTRKSLGFYIYSGFFFFIIFGSSINDDDIPSLSYMIDELTSSDGVSMLIVIGIPWLILLIRWYRSGLNQHKSTS
jgi:hypothetical protein